MNEEQFKKKVGILVNYYNARNYLYVIKEVQLLLKKVPNNPFLLNLLGSAFQNINELDHAKECFLRVTKIDPKNVSAYNNLGNVLKNQKDYPAALNYYHNALEIDPNFTKTILNLGNLNFELNKYDLAIELYKKALSLDEKLTLAHYNMGLAYQSLGKFDEAKKHLQQLLIQSPKFTIADKIISRFTKYTKADPHLVNMKKKLETESLDDIQKSNLYFAIGKAYEDMKDYENAFKNLKEANHLKDISTGYKIENDLSNFQKIKEFFEKNSHKSIEENNDKRKIIFILGMPRSGTSLVEQIISSHSKVYGCGELPFLENTMQKKFFDKKTISVEKLKLIDDLVYLEIAKDYMNKIKNYDNSFQFLTDKAPLNFRWIGFIKIMFPGAKIIHCSRSAKDNCLSLYKNSFDDGLDWTYKESNLIDFYHGYKDLMTFWEHIYPQYIHKISYEDLINDPEKHIKELLKYCDLDYENSCLEFYKNKRPIKTVSAAQARKPIYKSSVSSYQNFEPYLKELFSKL